MPRCSGRSGRCLRSTARVLRARLFVDGTLILRGSRRCAAATDGHSSSEEADDDDALYDESFFDNATREQLIEALKQKDQRISTGKQTIATLIEQITDYQTVCTVVCELFVLF